MFGLRDVTEDDLLCELRKKSHRAFEAIFKRYYADLFRFATAYVLDRETAEDIVQEVFCSLWDACERIPEQTYLKNYLYSSVKNACINHFKHLQVIDQNQERLTEALVFSGTLEYEDNEELLEQINSCLEQLSEQQQRILKMKVFYNMSYREIAAELNISEMTVHTHIKRAYRYIRETFPLLFGLLCYWERL